MTAPGRNEGAPAGRGDRRSGQPTGGPRPPRARDALGVCLAWALGFGLIATAYFTRGNGVLPLRPGHAGLALAEVLFYLAAAGVPALLFAKGAAMVDRRRGAGAGVGPAPTLAPAVALWTGPGILLAALAATLYRERINSHPTRVAGGLATLAVIAFVAVAVSVSLRAAARSAPRFRAARRGLLVTGLAMAAVGAAWLLTARDPRTAQADARSGATRAPCEPESTGLRILLIGMDGGTWRVLDPLMARGEMPHWSALAAEGATAALKTDVPTFSPIIWTSIASGARMQAHGVTSHVRTELPLPGLPWIPHNASGVVTLTKLELAPVRLLERAGALRLGLFGTGDVRVQRLWDLATRCGLPSVVVSWYVTHPAPSIRGVVVSDLFHRAGDLPEELPRAVWPDSLLPAFKTALTRPADVPPDFPFTLGLADSTGLDPAGRAALLERNAERLAVVRQEIARDLTSAAVLPRACAAEPDWRLAAVYFRAMDNSHHLFWEFRDLPAGDLDRHPERRFRGAVDAYYRGFCEPLLAKALAVANADEHTVVIMLSDHGWEDTRYAHERGPDGFFIMAGGPTLLGAPRGEISIYDVAPTVLALLGLPVPEDMAGHVARQFVDPAFWARHPVRTIPTYGPPAVAPASAEGLPLDEKGIRQLRALGYVR